MPAVNDFPNDLRPSLHLLADHEERRSVSRAREDLEHGRSSFGMWAIVEGERHARGLRKSA
jgi:hypothetical protein